MGKITFVMPDDMEEKFRKAVAITKGLHKGSLGTALTEAAKMWIKNSSHQGLTGSSKRLKGNR
jgi:hypothetical protein